MSFRCDRTFRVQPFFDTKGATNGDDAVTVRARDVVRRNFEVRVVHYGGKAFHEMAILPTPIVALPYAHYRHVTFAIHEGGEARILDAKVSVQFVAGPVGKNSRSTLHACYVRRWSLALTVS